MSFSRFGANFDINIFLSFIQDTIYYGICNVHFAMDLAFLTDMIRLRNLRFLWNSTFPIKDTVESLIFVSPFSGFDFS